MMAWVGYGAMPLGWYTLLVGYLDAWWILVIHVHVGISAMD